MCIYIYIYIHVKHGLELVCRAHQATSRPRQT